VTAKDGIVEKVEGNRCKRGAAYAADEYANPVRTLTTTMAVQGGGLVSVKTARPIPKSSLFACLEAIQRVAAVPPIKIGAVLLENVGGTGASVVATMNFGAADGVERRRGDGAAIV
jgi:CxxC motif-containing protein